MRLYVLLCILQGSESEVSECRLSRQVWALQRGKILPDKTSLAMEGRYQVLPTCDGECDGVLNTNKY